MTKYLLILCWFFINACTTDYDQPLGNGYLFVATNKYNHSIVKGHRPVVSTNIIDYELLENYVVGYRSEPARPDVPLSKISEKYGYFILNKKTGELEEGLSRERYMEKVKSLGINATLNVE